MQYDLDQHIKILQHSHPCRQKNSAGMNNFEGQLSDLYDCFLMVCISSSANALTLCQDRFFTDLIFQGVRGSGHGLVVRPKGYVA